MFDASLGPTFVKYLLKFVEISKQSSFLCPKSSTKYVEFSLVFLLSIISVMILQYFAGSERFSVILWF